MMEVMKIIVTFFKRSHALTATLSAPSPAAGHRQLTSLPETPGHSRASLGQSLVGSLLLSPGPGVHKQGFLKEVTIYLHYLHHSLASGQVTGREAQKTELKIC